MGLPEPMVQTDGSYLPGIDDGTRVTCLFKLAIMIILTLRLAILIWA